MSKFIKENRTWTTEDHGQPITFHHEYVYCEPTDEGAIPENELPENTYDDGGGFGAFRHYLYYMADTETATAITPKPIDCYVVIDQVYVGDHGHGVFCTVWAKCAHFSGLVSFPLEDLPKVPESVNLPDGRTLWNFVEFQDPDWSDKIKSPCNHESLNLFAPANYDRCGFLYRDTSDDGKHIDNHDSND